MATVKKSQQSGSGDGVRYNEQGEPWVREDDVRKAFRDAELDPDVWGIARLEDGRYALAKHTWIIAEQERTAAAAEQRLRERIERESLVKARDQVAADLAAARGQSGAVADAAERAKIYPSDDPLTCKRVRFSGKHSPSDLERVPVHNLNSGVSLSIPREVLVVLPNYLLWQLANAKRRDIRPNPRALGPTAVLGENPIEMMGHVDRYPFSVVEDNLPYSDFAEFLKHGNASMDRTLENLGGAAGGKTPRGG